MAVTILLADRVSSNSHTMQERLTFLRDTVYTVLTQMLQADV